MSIAMTSHTEIPEEIVEKAAMAIYDCEGDPQVDQWAWCGPGCRKYARAALDAVAPMLREKAFEAAELAVYRLKSPQGSAEWNRALEAAASAIRRLDSPHAKPPQAQGEE